MQLYTEIHDLVYHGNGGFLHSEVYNMPIHIRRFHLMQIQKMYEAEKRAQEKATNSMSNPSSDKIPKGPNIYNKQ